MMRNFIPCLQHECSEEFLAHFMGVAKKESKEDVWDEENKRTACTKYLCMEEEGDD